MSNRRSFLRNSAILSSSLFISGHSSGQDKSLNIRTAGSPVVLSTWNHGIQANKAAWEILGTGGKAVDAVEAGVRVPESDPRNTSVGLGGYPDRDGRVSLDASIMDEHGNCGAVACLEHIENPISVARKVMDDTPHVMLAGNGALEFALSQGFEKKDLLTSQAKKALKKWQKEKKYEPVINIENHDTIGMVALDQDGNLSGACTTSGLAFKMHGRVGDSPIIGAGLYVDNEIGAVTATGMGEAMIRVVASHLVVELMRQGYEPEKACEEAVIRISRKYPNYKNIQAGFLALRKDGEIGSFAIHKGFNYALMTASTENHLINSKFFVS